MFEVLSCAGKDAARWQSLIDQLPLEYRDVFFTPAYARVQQAIGQGPCFAAVYQWQEFFILHPFMQRGQELVSFYGGGGPISNLIGKADYRLWLWFEQEFALWRKDCKIISEYVRLHPLFEKEQCRMLRESGVTVEHLREAISVRIDMDDEKLLRSFSRNRQRGVKDASEHVMVEPSHDTELFDRLYQVSMRRLQAAQSWVYPHRVWGTYLFELMDEYCTLLIARGNTLATEAMLLMIHGYGKAYAHFIAGDGLSSGSGIGDLLYLKGMIHCRDVGCHTMFLGGGTTSNADDTLFQYKLGFSKTTVPVNFYRRSFAELEPLAHEQKAEVV